MVRNITQAADRRGVSRSRRSLLLAAAQPLEVLESRLFLSATVPAFMAPATIATGGAPTGIVTDDFNSDGNQDVAIAQGGSNSVAVLLGNGDGTFAAPVQYATGADPTAIAVGDFNNDGTDDIVTADAGSGDISILLGNADSNGNSLGTFAKAVNIHVEAPGGPLSLAVGDFNGDGNLDVAVAGANGLYVLSGNGDGTFSSPQLVASGNFSGGVVADSFSQTGNTDLAALDPAAGVVDVFPGNGDGTFAAPATYSVAAGASSIASGDFNNDGAQDIAVTVPGQNAVEVLLQNTTTVTEPTPTPITPTPIVPGPVSPEPLVPIAVGAPLKLTATAMLASTGGNSGSGSSSGGSYTYTTGAGTFAAPITIHLDQSPTSLVLGDVNGDGNLDIVTTNAANNSVTVIPGNGDGTFGTPSDIAVGSAPAGVAVDDFNGDGGQDLITANAGNGSTDTGSASVLVQQSSDVSVTLSASSDHATFGSDLTYTATITNTGPGAATGVSLNDYLPSNFTLVSATSSQGTVDTSIAGDISVSLGGLASGSTATVTIVVKATQYGPASNSVSVYTDSVNSSSSTYASVDTPVVGAVGTAELALTTNSSQYPYPIFAGPVGVAVPVSATPVGTAAPVGKVTASGALNGATASVLPVGNWWWGGARVGQDYTYTFTINNYGPDSASGVNFTDTLPGGVTFVSSSASQGTTDSSKPGKVTAALGDLAAGASATVTIVIKPTAVGTLTDSASVAATTPDPYLDDNSTTVTTYVYNGSIPTPILDGPVTTLSGGVAGAAPGASGAGKPAPTSGVPTLTIGSVRQVDVTKGATNFVFTVTRAGNLKNASTVAYATVNGTAKAGSMFTPVSGQLSFAAGASTATVTVPVKGLKNYTPTQTFVVALSRPTNATVKTARATGTIVSAVKAPKPKPIPNPFAKGVGINFEPPGGPAVKGYLEDTGLAFGARSNGFTYGWSSDNTAHAVIRKNKVKDARFDTFNVLGSGGASNWQISLPNGRYSVKLVAGDPSNSSSTYQVDANGLLLLNGKAKKKHPFVSGSATISVSNGILKLTAGSGVTFDKLDFVNIKYVGALK